MLGLWVESPSLSRFLWCVYVYVCVQVVCACAPVNEFFSSNNYPDRVVVIEAYYIPVI